MANTIKIKRGLSSNISNITLAQGELAITTDTNELYVGKESGKEKINVQANYNQNDEKAADYIRNRPFYEESSFDLLVNKEVLFIKNEDAIAAYSGVLSDVSNLSKVSKNSKLTLSIGTEIVDLTYINSLSNESVFVFGSANDSVYIHIKTDFTGLSIYLIGSVGSEFTETITLSGSNIHKLDSKFIQSYPDVDLKPYFLGSTDLINGTEYTKPTIVGARDSNNPDGLKVYLVSDGIVSVEPPH